MVDKNMLGEINRVKARLEMLKPATYDNKNSPEFTRKRFGIDTGLIGRNGKPNYKWNENIPYEELENHHTKKQITAEQVEAAKYFVKEKFNASKDVWNFKENSGEDAQIRSSLVFGKNLQNMVAEYKKEMENPEYQAQQRQSRVAREIAEHKRFEGVRTK